jgi:epoxyqueuosine reductase
MKAAVRQRALELGFDECRFTTAEPPETGPQFERWLGAGMHGEMGYLQRNAHKRLDPRQVLPGARSTIILAVSYSRATNEGRGARGEVRGTRDEGVIARYARFADYHTVIGGRLKSLAEFVNQQGGAGTRSLGYVDTGPVLERDLAQRAGLGFVGKHTNLIGRKLGNWFFLCEILTTLELEPDGPESNRCGSCTRCLTTCPTVAITAPFQLDARRCISYLTIELKGSIPVELRPAIGNRIFGCDDCLAVCPWNRFAQEGSMMKPHARPDLEAPDLIELLKLDEGDFNRRFGGTPLERVKRRGLLRNICVALGNVGDERVLGALQKAAVNSEPLIAEHALWGISQIRARVKNQAAG